MDIKQYIFVKPHCKFLLFFSILSLHYFNTSFLRHLEKRLRGNLGKSPILSSSKAESIEVSLLLRTILLKNIINTGDSTTSFSKFPVFDSTSYYERILFLITDADFLCHNLNSVFPALLAMEIEKFVPVPYIATRLPSPPHPFWFVPCSV